MSERDEIEEKTGVGKMLAWTSTLIIDHAAPIVRTGAPVELSISS